MYDSTTASDIPANAAMVAGYVDGAYRWSASDWSRFPNAVKVRIAVSPSTNDGVVLDCETGDATPAQCPGWVRMRQAAGVPRPTIYCNRSTWPQVQQACAGLDVAYWIADWTGAAHDLPGAAAVQYADPPTSGGHWDLTAVYDDSWPSAPSTAPAITPPTSISGKYMRYVVTLTTDDQGNGWDNQFENRNIPWDKFVAVSHRGSDPMANADKTYWPGSAHVQERDGKVLVSVTGCRANSPTEYVFVTTTE